MQIKLYEIIKIRKYVLYFTTLDILSYLQRSLWLLAKAFISMTFESKYFKCLP